jgi:hypothetical protein
LKRLNQVHNIGGQLRLGSLRIAEFPERRVRPHRFFDMLLLEQHLCCGSVPFVFEQPVDQFHARIVERTGRIRIAR